MSATNLRRGSKCATCATPVAIRAEVARRARAGESLRSISEFVVNEGHGLGRAAITLHIRQCLGIEERVQQEVRAAGVVIAHVVCEELQGWSKRQQVADRVAEAGFPHEAAVVRGEVPESLQCSMPKEDTGDPAAEMLAVRLLCRAIGRVLGRTYPEASLAIADDLEEHGGHVLAEDFRFLANRASLALAEAP